jgi:hypothetical protein
MNSKQDIGKRFAATGKLALALLAAAAFLCTGLEAAPAGKTREAEQGKIPFPKPSSHTSNWLEYHGRSIEPSIFSPVSSDNTCLVCHEKIDCISCHATRAPRDHTNTWRTRSHGFMAEGNRDRCQICHKQDFCVRCHNETAPRTHVGNWKTNHCTWCHANSGQNNECSVCHKIVPPPPHPRL